jgi:hypothetical protein
MLACCFCQLLQQHYLDGRVELLVVEDGAAGSR